jgi:hypothetical protein
MMLIYFYENGSDNIQSLKKKHLYQIIKMSPVVLDLEL